MSRNYDYEEDIFEVDRDFYEDDFDEDNENEMDSYEEESEVFDEDKDSKTYEEEVYDIQNHSLLTHEETFELLKKAQAGDGDAKAILVERNIRLVKSIARTFPSNQIISKLDLIQEGVIGLIKAIDRFDLKKGYKFSTYATWWVRQAMQRALADNGKTIKVPVYLQEELFRIKKVQKSLEQKLNRMPSIEEISEALHVDCSFYHSIVEHDFFPILVESICGDDNGEERKNIESIIIEDLEFNSDAELVLKSISELIAKKKRRPSFEEVNKELNLDVKKIKEILDTDINSNVASLNVPANDDFDTNYGDNIASDENLEKTVSQNLITEGLLRALDEVYGTGNHSFEYYIKTHSNKENKNYDPTGKKFIPKNELMKYRYGIGGYQKETLEQLGKRYNVSRERIRQIEKKILGNEVDKDGNLKAPHKDTVAFKKKVKEYCGFEFSDFS